MLKLQTIEKGFYSCVRVVFVMCVFCARSVRALVCAGILVRWLRREDSTKHIFSLQIVCIFHLVQE